MKNESIAIPALEKVIFVNIFGGIVRCDLIAQGVLNASDEVPGDRHIVVRLDGTNVELGKKILEDGAKEKGLNIVVGNTMADAAEKAVKLAEEAEAATKKSRKTK